MDYPVHESTSFKFYNFLIHPCDFYIWANVLSAVETTGIIPLNIRGCSRIVSFGCLKEINTLTSHIHATGVGNLMFKIKDTGDKTVHLHTGTFIDQYIYRPVYFQISTYTD